MEEALIAELLADTALAAIVDGRLTWGTRTQAGGLPAVLLTRVSGLPDYRMDGATGLVVSRVQVDCYAATYAGAKGAARAVEAAIGGRRFTRAGVRFEGVFVIGHRDTFEAEASGAERVHRVMIDYQIWHRGA